MWLSLLQSIGNDFARVDIFALLDLENCNILSYLELST